MNNKIIVALAFACLTIAQNNLFAQEKTQTLFNSGKPVSFKDVGFFVAPSVGFTQMDGDAVSLFNLRAGVNLKDKIAVGGYFNTSMNQIKPVSETVPNVYMDYWSAGGFVEYTVLSRKAFHVTFPLYIGYGEVEMDNENGSAGLGEAGFFQIEPSAMLEVNLNKYVRFNAGAGYRVIGQMDYRNFNQSDISGLTGYVGLKFGLF